MLLFVRTEVECGKGLLKPDVCVKKLGFLTLIYYNVEIQSVNLYSNQNSLTSLAGYNASQGHGFLEYDVTTMVERIRNRSSTSVTIVVVDFFENAINIPRIRTHVAKSNTNNA